MNMRLYHPYHLMTLKKACILPINFWALLFWIEKVAKKDNIFYPRPEDMLTP